MEFPTRTVSRAAFALSLLAVILAGVAMLAPVASFSTSFFGATAEADGYVWQAKFRATGFGQSSEDTKSWFDEGFDDQDGHALVRAAGPLLALACLVNLGAAVATVLPMRWPSLPAIAAAAAALLVAGSLWILAQGIKNLFDDQQQWTWGFWLLIATAVVAAAASALAFIDWRRPRSHPAPGTTLPPTK